VRWTQPGARAVLDLRAVRLTNGWVQGLPILPAAPASASLRALPYRPFILISFVYLMASHQVAPCTLDRPASIWGKELE
jgi:hypothetical protein